jgi:putative ABC transport system permease protein
MVVVTLALGIGTTTAMFAIVHAALLEPLPYADPERLVLARRTVGGDLRMWNSAPDYYDYREQTDAFQSFARVAAGARKATVTGGERPERVSATRVSDDLFATLGVAPVAGRTFHPDEGRAGAPYVVMVSERLARRRFGDARSAVGRTLGLSGLAAPENVSATIVGVMPDSFRFLDAVDAWGVIRRGENDGPATRQFHNWIIVARLKPGVSIETAQRQADVVSGRLQQLYPATNKTKALRLDPLQSAIFQPQRPRLLMLTAAVSLVLLIACANVAGLLLARGIARRSEFAVRAALGASRARLMRELLVESLSLSVLAGLAGMGLATGLERVLPVATGLADSGVSASALEGPVLLFALAVSIATGVAAGIAPALRASRRGPASDLGPGTRATDSRGGARMQSLLVVMQVGVSLLLLVGAGLFIRSFARLSGVELGFDAHHVLTGEIQLPFPDAARRIQFFTGLRDDIATLPGVSAVSFTSHVPVRDPAGDPPMWAEGRPPVDSSQTQSAALRVVLPGYFETLRIPIVGGRDLAETDRNGTQSVLVINQAMARRLFPAENPLGKRIIMPRGGAGPLALEIVGVVGDARIYGVGVRAPMTMYASVRQMPANTLNLVLRTETDPQLLIGAVREAVAARHRDVAVENLVRLEDTIGDSLAPERVLTITIVMFSAVALLLASLGLYGVLAYQVTQRRHEIGVRMALGASARTVLLNVMARSGLLVAPGLALGLAGAIAGTRLMARQLYDIAPHDPVAIVIATATLAVVACGASALPAWRAARVNPVQALRGE